jgi:hypothetical protein
MPTTATTLTHIRSAPRSPACPAPTWSTAAPPTTASPGYAQYGLVVYRRPISTNGELIAFSRMLGQVVIVPTGGQVRPEIQTITLDQAKTNSLLAAYRAGKFSVAHRRGDRRGSAEGHAAQRPRGARRGR